VCVCVCVCVPVQELADQIEMAAIDSDFEY